MASNFLENKLREFANKIAGVSVVDNEKNPNSALNRQKRAMKNSNAKPSWQARGVKQNLDKMYSNTKGKTFGVPGK